MKQIVKRQYGSDLQVSPPNADSNEQLLLSHHKDKVKLNYAAVY